MDESRIVPRALTIRVRLINTKINSKAIRRQMEVLRVTMGFTLLKASGCASVTSVVGLINHITLSSMIHGTPVYKIIKPLPFLLPMSFKRK